MLRGIDPLLGPEALSVLRAMGHGDDLVLVDANFPADAAARRLVRIDAVGIVRVLRAVLGLLPVDDFEPDPLIAMQVVGDPDAVPDVLAEMQVAADEILEPRIPIARLERFEFYARARSAYAVFATGERAFYGNLIIRKGVIPPAA